MKHNPLDFDGILDRLIAGSERLPHSIIVAADNSTENIAAQATLVPTLSARPSKRTFDITLIAKDKSSRPATIETDGNVPEIIRWQGVFFKLNLALGQPYLYLQIYGAELSDIEVVASSTKDMQPSSSLIA